MGGKQKKKKRELINATTVGMAQDSLIQKNGEAASQIIQAYKGKRYDSLGNDIGHSGRSLKQISEYKLNEQYRSQNIKQQSGFSAELIKEARDNKEAIKSGSQNRTRTTDGIGQTNHQQYDHIVIDESGNVIDGSGSQMKFLSMDKKGRAAVVDSIAKDPKWEKYDGYIDVPEDQYDKAVGYSKDKAKSLREQSKSLREKRNYEKANELEAEAQKYEDAGKKLRKSNVKESEAVEARLDPKKFTSKEVAKGSHKAGIEAAKGALVFSAGVSTAQNLYAVIRGERDMDEAISDVAKTTAKAGAVAYGVGASGTAIKSLMHSSGSSLMRKLGTTNAPAMIATGTVEVAKSMRRYAAGEIDEVELLEELGEKGTGMVAAGFGAAVGTLVLPGIGSLVGSILGYSVSGMLYKGSLGALKNEKISAERRAAVEAISESCIREMKLYQRTLTEYAALEFQRREDVFSGIFMGIRDSILNDELDGFFESINSLGGEFGLNFQFKTFDEFDDFMNDDSLKLSL